MKTIKIEKVAVITVLPTGGGGGEVGDEAIQQNSSNCLASFTVKILNPW
jgi:hypothetical protein